MENLKKLKFSIVALLLFGCAGSNTFIMKEVYTYPEERYVLEAVPVIPVEIKELDEGKLLNTVVNAMWDNLLE